MTAWKQLLSASRLGTTGTGSPDPDRTAFQRDFDRIVFSSAFRRLQDKTQVHPLPNSDYVRRRLTHSLEVSCVARSLGTHFGQELRQRRDASLASIDELAALIGQITAAAALAHDIGNPPFGHVGEEAIAHWFRENASALPSDLSTPQRSDLESFEGNAQGFRILARLANNRRGLGLTAATLGAFTKYPTCSTARNRAYVGHKKYGYFEAEREMFANVAEKCGLIVAAPGQWKRHPLAFLVEAADDICYRIIDVEDGVKLGRIAEEQAEECLAGFLAGSHKTDYESESSADLGWLRAKAIGSLIDATQTVFLANENAILSGAFSDPLLEHTPMAGQLKKAKQLVIERVFSWDRTVKAESAGARMLTALLSDFVEALRKPANSLNAKLLSLIPDFPAAASSYERILAVTDHISGMTDTFLLQTYRQVHGHSISGA